MIHITDKCNCCGCSSCLQVCPKQCISLHTDEEGFAYSFVDDKMCIDCGLCEKVCPNLNQSKNHRHYKAYTAKNPNDTIRTQSSSGGIFSMLAEQTINAGGVVFGARFNEIWEVTHDYIETTETISTFRGSKYVQSKVGSTYHDAQNFLKKGRKVMFSGTPCQIAGLKKYLKIKYDNLITVDCVCHGVPSPKLWQQYLNEQAINDRHNISEIKQINFRDKFKGWRNYYFTIKYCDESSYSEHHDSNPWIRAIINNLGLRPSCYDCKFKINYSQADITLGDLWGAEQFLQRKDDDKGESLVICHSKKGQDEFNSLSLDVINLSFSEVIKYNPAIVYSAKEHAKNKDFIKNVNRYGFINTVKVITKDPLALRVKLAIGKMIGKI